MTDKLVCEWTADCQGKQDYDAGFVRLSTRYWPRGGGFTAMILDEAGIRVEENDARPEINPSATATIMLQDQDIAEKSFTGETESDVKAQVEDWAQTQFERIARTVRDLYA